MLPDFPETKKLVREQLDKYLKKMIYSNMPAFQDIAKESVFEGRSILVKKEDDDTDVTLLQEFSANEHFTVEEIENMSIEMVMQKLHRVAVEMSGKIEEGLFTTIKDATEKHNMVTKSADPFGAESILEALNKIHMSFNSNGVPSNITVIVHPNMRDKLEEALSRLNEDGEFKKRYEEILNKKREEWREEEASRKLVG